MILVANPKAQYLHYKPEIDAAIERVLEKGRYVLGDEVRSFETEFAAFVGAAFAVGVGSGTEALHLALKACNVGPGDEVITVSHTAVATVAAIELTGATPVLVDVDPIFYTIDPAQVKAALTPRTKAVIAVHLYGQPADLKMLSETTRAAGVTLIEDCAQAHGATFDGRRVGSYGQLGCFSFYPTKNLGAIGDGGMVVTSDPALAERLRLLREYGWAEKYISRIAGWNTRLDELQAAILRVKLKYLDQDNAARAKIAGQYDQALASLGLKLPQAKSGATHVYHLYVVQAEKRDALIAFLSTRGIAALIHYPVPVHLQPAYKERLRPKQPLALTEKISTHVLSLPLYPELSAADWQTTTAAIQEFCKRPDR